MRPRVIVVMGVSGSGKSSVGSALAARLGWTFVEGDAFHPEKNVAKMSRGEPLTDADRLPWLIALRNEIERCRAAGGRCVVACSALKRAYREVLKKPGETDVAYVFLSGAASLIRQRMGNREHFMKTGMLESQLATLEEPRPEEALRVELDRSVEEIVTSIVERLELSARR